MVPVIISIYMTERLPYRSTMDSSHIETLHIPGLSKQARKVQFFPKMKISPLISLVVLLLHYAIIFLGLLAGDI